jgi:hypothetical protein
MTPIHIIANIAEMFKPLTDPAPSEALRQAARLELAEKLYSKRTQEANAQTLV